ncbi:MAG: OmpP1/FadL family transporter [Neisseriaceae bacterium]
MEFRKNSLVGLIFLASGSLLASGMAVPVSSVGAASTADANAAEADTPATLVANPAGLTYLTGTIIENNLFILQPHFYYTGGKGYYFRTHEPIGGSTSGSIGHRLEIPGLFFSHRFPGKLAIGFGMYAPFGADFAYPLDSVMRYNGNRVRIISVSFNPNVAIKLNAKHSLGLGIYGIYSQGKVRQFADITHGVYSYAHRFTPLFDPIVPTLIPAGAFEAYATLKAKGWGYGFNLGWLWDVNDVLRVGLSFRSKTHTTFKGMGLWQTYDYGWDWPIVGPVMENIMRRVGYVNKEPVRYTLTYPEVWQMHVKWQANDRLALLGNLAFSRNSQQNSIHINWTQPKMGPDASTNAPALTSRDYTNVLLNFKDSLKLSLGLTYQYSDPLQLRAGVMFDQSAARGPKGRSPITPDNDRFLLGLGANYRYNSHLSIGGSYNFLRVKDSKIEATNYCGSKIELGPGAHSCVDSRGRATGMVRSRAHIVGLNIRYQF